MSTTDAKPSRKQRQRESKSHPAPSDAERLKTIVRRLPPNLPEEIFWQSVQAWVTDDTVTWKTYCPGKLRTKRVHKDGIGIPSRAYIAFKNEDQVATFSREYDGHVFRDKAGNESQAIVEFASFQKVPSEKRKADARSNTIDKDEDYLSFLETLKNAPKTESVSLETLIAASQPPPPPTTTPLLEALKAEKSAQKDKEAILRNHAHYKEAAASGASSKKEEAKKKVAAAAAAVAATVQPPRQPEIPASSLSKKAKKAAAAAHKASSTQVQDGQSPPGKSQPPGAGTASSAAKSPTPASASGHAPRHRPPKEPHTHGRPHSGKGDTSLPIPPSTTASVSTTGPSLNPTLPPPVTTENAPSSAPAPGSAPQGQGQGQRKNRPVIGLGRQFEAALNGAGVAVTPSPSGDRKKRDKGGESASGPGPGAESGRTVSEGSGKGSKRQHHPRREEHGARNGLAAVVPSILQRPETGGGGSASVMIIQRPQSPRGTDGSGGHTEGTSGAGAGSGGARESMRRGRGRGRGGHRGG